ncbi:hypothetical protein ACFQU7_21730 [Pseudoroseomonas wenyumeiae]
MPKLTLDADSVSFNPIKGNCLPLRPPPGCPFHARCPKATERCVAERPALRPLSPAWEAACHYA